MKSLEKMGGISQIFEFYCIFINKYFQILGKKVKFLALFSVKAARDEKFGKNGGISQIFEFYFIFITKFFRKLSRNLKF